MATLMFRLLQRESTNGDPTARLMPAKPATMQCLFVGITRCDAITAPDGSSGTAEDSQPGRQQYIPA